MSTASPIPRAPAALLKVQEADAKLEALEAKLAVLQKVSGAAAKLQALENAIKAARRERQRWRQAHRGALQLDAQAAADERGLPDLLPDLATKRVLGRTDADVGVR